MKNTTIYYEHTGEKCEGYLSLPPSSQDTDKYPTILIAHDWGGRGEFAINMANEMTKKGYAGFAIDMYGNAQLGNTNEEKSSLMDKVIKDRKFLQERIVTAFNTIKKHPNVNSNKIAAIGFCFGGLCVLDLARSGADIKGVISFHGFLHGDNALPNNPIKAKILAFHGYKDTMVSQEHLTLFENECNTKKVDWELIQYGIAYHAFTNPKANDTSLGTIYNSLASQRAFHKMYYFFDEIFGN